MQKKRIGFLIPSLSPGGAERVIVSLANKFSCRYDVFLIVFYKSETVYSLNENVVLIFLEQEYTPSISFFSAIKNNTRYLKKIIKIVKNYHINLLVGFTTNVNILTVIASIWLRIPNIISERNNPEVYIPNALWKFLRNLLYPFTNLLIVQTEFIKEFYKRIISENKIEIVSNPLNESSLSLRKEYCNRENVILTVGRLDANKNQKLLIEAFANLKLKNWRLVLAGDGILREEYQKITDSLRIANQVDFVGNVSSVWEYYNEAKIFVFTSQSEGFPNALLEAMSFGLPCISTDCPSGPSEIIKNNENGFLIEMNNIEQLENRLISLINSPKLRSQFSVNALSSVERYRMDVIYLQWESLMIKLF